MVVVLRAAVAVVDIVVVTIPGAAPVVAGVVVEDGSAHLAAGELGLVQVGASGTLAHGLPLLSIRLSRAATA